ncbi:FHA domain protein [Clostridium cavendishii DSM 21758]|uniref:FHA domain protein n=2 Tax=Clostridium TaxID=1485 RepID=A0A1M6QHM6_9CLOT|nr:FHA domain protein [Clostridium cavendishii DSM 21758]
MVNSLINFSSNSNSSKSYLVATISNEPIIDFQLEMINSLEDGGLLSIEKRQFNLDIQLFYDTTSLVSLETFFSNNKLNKSKIIKVLNNLCTGALEAEEHYLVSNNYILDGDKIFIDEEKYSIKYVYLPIEKNYIDDVNLDFKNLIKSIIVDYANIEEETSDNYIQKILNYIKKQGVTIREFHSFLTDELSSSSQQVTYRPKETISTPIESRQAINSGNLNYNSNSLNNSNYSSNSISQVDRQRQNGNNSSNIGTSSPQNNSSNKLASKVGKGAKGNTKTEVVEEVKEVYKTVNIIIAAIMQLLFIGISVSVFLFITDFEITEKGGAVLLVGALDFLVTKSALDKKKKVKVKVSKKVKGVQEKDIQNNKKDKKDKKDKKAKINSNVDNNTNNNVNNNPPSVNLSKREISTEAAFETELLSTNYPFLLADKGGAIERIYISKDRFRLGRLSSQVDYTILNKAVGKVHAEIIKVGDTYVLVDLNSKNGTFINGERLSSNSEYPLRENDVVAFANEKYIFKFY